MFFQVHFEQKENFVSRTKQEEEELKNLEANIFCFS